MKLFDLGEEALISKLIRDHNIPTSAEGLLVGAGDDAAVLAPSAEGWCMVITTDMLSENMDYRDDTTTPYCLGWKSAAANISDIAAMGGKPTWALVSLGFRSDTDVEYISRFYDGFIACGNQFGSQIIGGDVNEVIGDNTVSVTQMGIVTPDMLLRRNGAQPGDRIFVAGNIGCSRAGSELLTRYGLSEAERLYPNLIKAHIMPQPRVNEARALACTRKVTALMDISDGIGSDLPKLCNASGVGAEIYADMIPIDNELKDASMRLGIDPIDLVVAGGEDYELLFTTSPSDADILIETFRASCKIPLYEIGQIVEEGVSLIMPDKSHRLLKKGWEHYSS